MASSVCPSTISRNLSWVILVNFWELPLHQICTWPWNAPHQDIFFITHPHYHSPALMFPSTTIPGLPKRSLLFPLSRKIHATIFWPSITTLYTSVDCTLIIITLHLIFTYQWVHTMLVFLGLDYIPQDEFFPSFSHLPSNFLLLLLLAPSWGFLYYLFFGELHSYVYNIYLKYFLQTWRSFLTWHLGHV